MPESSIIPTQTTLTVVGSTITILTEFFNEINSGVINAFIIETVGGEIVDGVIFAQGEGGITMEDDFFPDKLNFFLNVDGDLIVTAPDATSFNIDGSTGQLQYTT